MADEPLIEPLPDDKAIEDDKVLDTDILAKLDNIEKREDERWIRLMEKLETLERTQIAQPVIAEEPPPTQTSEPIEEPVTVIEVETPPEPKRRSSRGWW